MIDEDELMRTIIKGDYILERTQKSGFRWFIVQCIFCVIGIAISTVGQPLSLAVGLTIIILAGILSHFAYKHDIKNINKEATTHVENAMAEIKKYCGTDDQ